jgi:hypothetical protein
MRTQRIKYRVNLLLHILACILAAPAAAGSHLAQGALTRTTSDTDGGRGVLRGCGSREQDDFEVSSVLSQFSIQSRYLWYRYRYSQNIGKLLYNQNIGKLLYNQNIGKILYNQNIGKILCNQNI